jgi:hypothetical protein
MKDLSQNRGLFKSGIVSGVGANNGGGGSGGGLLPQGKNGAYSYEQMKNFTPAQYAKIREATPELLGQPRRKKR